MIKKWKKFYAGLLSLLIFVTNIFSYADVVVAMTYDSKITVIKTNKLEQTGMIFINGETSIKNGIPELSKGIFSLLNSETLIHTDLLYENNEYKNETSVFSKGSIQIDAGNIIVSNVIAAKGNIIFNTSNISSEEYTIIYSENGNIEFSADTVKFNGIIYAPNGMVKMNASSLKIDGKIISDCIHTNASVFEINGNTTLDLLERKLEFLSDDVLLKMNPVYDDNNHDYFIEIDEQTKKIFQTLEIFIRYDNEKEFVKLYDYSSDFIFKLREGYKYADLVVKGTMVSGKYVYSNIDSFCVDEDGTVMYTRTDSDGDGIIDGAEILITKTDPYNKDTDSDGLSDFEECFFLYTNPLKKTEDEDFDKDGLSNFEEIERGTNPFLADCDIDGILDGYDEEPLVCNADNITESKDIVITTGMYDIIINGYDEKGNIYQYIYDPINELVKANCYNDIEILYFYDIEKNKIANIRKCSDGVRASSNKYDSDRNVISYSNHGNVYEFEYNDLGVVTSTMLNGKSIISKGDNTITYGNGDILSIIENSSEYSSYVNEECVDTTIYDENGKISVYKDNVTGITYNYEYTDDHAIVNRISNNAGYGISYECEDNQYNVVYSYHGEEKEQSVIHQENESKAKSKLISGATYIESTNNNQVNSQIKSDRNNIIISADYSFDNEEIVSTKINGTITKYTYNDKGQIINVYENETLTFEYKYNNYGQLAETINYINGTTEKYFYDMYNNIQKVDLYDSQSRTVIKSDYYIYNNSEYSDRLSEYNGERILYDQIGNPLQYINGTSLTWTGRWLNTVNTDKITANYTYSSSGIRTSKEINGEKTIFFYDGKDIVAEETNGECVWYIYDNTTQVIGFIYGGQDYYYIKNVANDILSVVDNMGNVICGYSYDAWGNVTDIYGDISIANINPYRYKSYYYDKETGWYFLQTRYYDPEIRRFISMDDASDVVDEEIDPNLYAYCCGDPVNLSDPTGEAAKIAIFTTNEFKVESRDYLKKELIKSFGAFAGITIKETNSKTAAINDFKEWWEEKKNYDILYINTHGSPTYLFYEESGGSILDSIAEYSSNSYKNLGRSNAKIVVVLGCNCGHWDFCNRSIAYRLACLLNSGIVLASDGTVYTDKKCDIFLNYTVKYESKKDETFDRLHGTQDVRDNYGWIAYTRRIGDGTYFENKILTTTLIYNLYKNDTYKKYK